MRGSLVVRASLPDSKRFLIDSHHWQVGIPFIPVILSRFLLIEKKNNKKELVNTKALDHDGLY